MIHLITQSDQSLFLSSDLENQSEKREFLPNEWQKVVRELDLQIAHNNWNDASWNQLWASFINCQLYLILQEKTLMGFALLSIIPKDQYVHLWKIVIDSKFRMKGFGNKLMHFIIQHNSSKSILLEVESTNAGAISFYEMLGFKKNHFVRHFYSDGKDAWKMSLEVAKGL